MTAPLVSVLLPARNAAATLRTALDSIARQRDVLLECVVVDDASQDATRQIAETFAKRDARVRIVPGAGSGIVDALERGLEACRGAFIARMDADDWMHRDRLRLQVALFRSSRELAAVGTHVRVFPRPLNQGMGQYEAWLNSLVSSDDIALNAFVECPIAHPTLMIRREVIETHRYRKTGWPEDYDLVLRLLGASERLAVVPRRLHGWRDGAHRLSRVHPDYGLDRFTACKALYLSNGFLSRAKRYVLCGYGDTGRSLRAALAEHGRTPALIVDVHPGRIGNAIHGAAVVGPDALTERTELPIVASVSGARRRASIRTSLESMGYAEGVDFICAA